MTRAKLIKSFIFLFASIAILNYVVYSLSIAIDVPRGDHWRWLKSALIPYLDGDISFFEYLTYEFYPLSHSHILTISNIWINYSFFDLDYRVESYIGLISMLLATFLICKHFINKQTGKMSNNVIAVTITVFLAVLLNTRNVNPWTLVQFEYIYVLLSVIFILIVDAFINHKLKNYVLVSAFIMMFFIGDATGSCVLLALIAYLFLFHFKEHWSTGLAIIVALLIAISLSHYLIPNMRPHTTISKLDAFAYLILNPIDTLKTTLIMFSQAIVEKQAILHFFPNTWLSIQYTVGVVIFSFVILAIYNTFKFKEMKDTPMPVLLIMLCLVAMLGVLLTRFPTAGVDAGHASRYIRLFQLGFIGAVWINVIALVQYTHNANIKKVFYNISAFLALSVILGFSLHTYFLWKYKPSVEKYFNNEIQHLQRFSMDQTHDLGPHILRCKNSFCNDSVVFLKDNQLSIFRKSDN